ncbi:TetR/AcrR family transcriptional regulator [bacterium]|nr:TetR/AcrR family transcriptional regulator [bacterium]
MQNDTKKKLRGRPRVFDEARARQAILESFWERGYSSVSLDDLSQATGMGRPSLYAAFGNKEQMYLAALQHFRQLLGQGIRRLLADRDLLGFYLGALELYQSRGCMIVCTATVEATSSPAIAALVNQTLEELDRALTDYFRSLDGERDPIPRARQAAAWLHSLAIRARAGQSSESLQALARQASENLG